MLVPIMSLLSSGCKQVESFAHVMATVIISLTFTEIYSHIDNSCAKVSQCFLQVA